MVSIIRMKRSAVATKVPTTAQLDLGELAINTRDGKLFLKCADGTEQIVEVGARWGAFTAEVSGRALLFKHNGAPVTSLAGSRNPTLLGNVRAYGSP